jgi:prolyl oligopeptidase
VRKIFIPAFILTVAALSAVQAQVIRGRGGISLPAPPDVSASPVIDNYSGTKITDNYRWLEDAQSNATKKFIDDQNAYTARYMQLAKMRPQVVDDLTALVQVGKWSIPIERADNYYFTKRLAGEEQAAIYIRVGWAGKDKRIVDPATFSRDTNTSVDLADVSRDGNLVAYEVREGGADETTVHFFDVKANKDLFDEIPAGLHYSVAFTPDSKGVFYTRTDAKGTLLYQHTFGERTPRDILLFGREFRAEAIGPVDLLLAWVTSDGRYLVVQVERGVPAKRVDIVFRDLTKPNSFFDVLTWGIEARFSPDYDNGKWYIKTDYQSPNGRILKADPGIMPEAWTTVIPEGQDPIDNFSIVGHKLYVNLLHDVKTQASVYSLDGKPAGKIEFETIGTSSGVSGRSIDRYGFYSFESFTVPQSIYRIDTTTGKSELFAKPKIDFDPAQYEVKQVFYKTKDGTQVPMFIAGAKDIKQDGTERLLMTGYGGFDVSETPAWNPMWAWWLEQGGWFAVPNLRGGGEYGEKWHEQGMFEHKQNVFDDFFAAAEYLIQNKYTSPQHFAISGRSNGGLLMGAAITQQPQLFSAVVCGYPLLDMLRYQKFEQGAHWTTEYGSSEESDQLPYLLKYSPYQNVKKGTSYPAVLFFTGSSDSRVDPLHARKMTALMQANSTSGRPILLHYGLAGGHSSGVGVEQEIQDGADQLTFLWTETGAPPSTRQLTPQK